MNKTKNIAFKYVWIVFDDENNKWIFENEEQANWFYQWCVDNFDSCDYSIYTIEKVRVYDRAVDAENTF